MSTLCQWGAIFLTLALTSCISHLNIPETEANRISSQFSQKSYWLKQSLYGGPFYDDRRFRLAHARRFEELTYLKNPDGKPILPPPADEILPVGTKVEVVKIEWPTTKNILKRPVYTPRFTPWVHLRVGFLKKQTYILLLPGGIHHERAFASWFNSVFSNQDTTDWLFSLPESHKKAILSKTPLVGMDTYELEAALGMPDRLIREQSKETAYYGPTSVVLENGKVVSVDGPKK